MLYINSLNPTGMFSFGETSTVHFVDKGLIHVVGVNLDKGGSNGAGKSSVFNSLCEILFGENPTKVSGVGVVNTVLQKGFGGRVVFTNSKREQYRVTSCRNFKLKTYESDNNNHSEYKGTALFFEKYVNSVWVDFRGASMDATRSLILAALGLTYRQFLAVSYMSPRGGNLLLRGSNQDKLSVLSSIVGLHDWDNVLENVRSAKRAVNAEMQTSERSAAYQAGQLQVLQDQIAANVETQGQRAQLQESYAAAEASLVTLVQEGEKIVVQVRKLDQRVHASFGAVQEGSHKKLSELSNQIQKLTIKKLGARELNVTETEIAANITKQEDYIKTCHLGVVDAVAAMRVYKADNAFAGVDNCPLCGTKITKKAKAKLDADSKKMEVVVSDNKQKFEYAQRGLTDLEVLLKAAKEVSIKELEAALSLIDAEIAKLNIEYSSINEAYIQRLSEYEAQKNLHTQSFALKLTNDAQVTLKKQLLSGITSSLGQLDAQEAIRKRLEVQMETLQQQEESTQQEIQLLMSESDHLAWFISNIPYIKLHKLSVALTDLSSLTNGYLSAMGETVRLDITSFKEKKNRSKDDKRSLADLLKSEISIKAVDGKKEIDTKLFSDGETAKLTNALVRGLHALARKTGQGCNLVLLDEIFSYVDEENSQKIAESFSAVASEHTTLVTDNSGIFSTLYDATKVWTVEKCDGLSTIKQ